MTTYIAKLKPAVKSYGILARVPHFDLLDTLALEMIYFSYACFLSFSLFWFQIGFVLTS